MTHAEALSTLPPRIQRMLALILTHQADICAPAKGELTLHFSGRHVSAHLTGRRVLAADDQPPPRPC